MSRPCQGFVIGGNCAGQNTAIDNNIKETAESVKNDFQMGHFGGPNTRFDLNRIKPSFPNKVEENFGGPNKRFGLNRIKPRFTTISTTLSTSTTTATSPDPTEVTTSMSPELQEMRDHIMDMNAHDLRDAIMDPMMLGSLFFDHL